MTCIDSLYNWRVGIGHCRISVCCGSAMITWRAWHLAAFLDGKRCSIYFSIMYISFCVSFFVNLSCSDKDFELPN